MRRYVKKVACFAMILILLVGSFVGCGKLNRTADERDLDAYRASIYNLAGTDALGRKVEVADGIRDDGVYVGMWYSIWHGQHPDLQTDIRDIQKLLDAGAEGKAKLEDLSDWAQFYYWGEPLYGYYDSTDPFVLSRHIELFTNAGIDFLLIDVTNAYVYETAGTVFLGGCLGLIRRRSTTGIHRLLLPSMIMLRPISAVCPLPLTAVTIIFLKWSKEITEKDCLSSRSGTR